MPNNDSPSYFVKDPAAILDYVVNWGDNWLGSDTLATSTWTLPAGTLVKVTDTFDNDKATIWLASGTVGVSYDIVNRITTAGGRQDERTIVVNVRQK